MVVSAKIFWAAALPMLIAQILNLLYNIVDRVYIGPHAPSGNGSTRRSRTLVFFDCIISAFANLFGAAVPRIFPSTEEKRGYKATRL